jgi:sugar-specific transcriptional regulator TrmB
MIGVFGNDTAEKVLLFIQNYGSGYSREISRTFDIPQSMVYKQLLRLEQEYVLVNRQFGRTRMFEFNPAYAFRNELSALLQRAIDLTPETDRQRWFLQRRGPRRVGKPL